MRQWLFLAILILCASVAGVVFIFRQENTVVIESIPIETPGQEASQPVFNSTTTTEPETNATSSPEIKDEEIIHQSEEIFETAGSIIAQTQKFIEEEKARALLVAKVKEKSDKVKGIYVGSARNFSRFEEMLDQTELNALVVDIKESYGLNLSSSLRSSIAQLKEKDVWMIARIAVFRDSSLIEEKPEWYLTFSSTTQSTTSDATSTVKIAYRDSASQYWLDPQNKEVRNYIIDFSKRAVDFGFDELQFDYVRYPDNYEEVPGQEKIAVIGDFLSEISNTLKTYKPTVILSADFFGYVATQFNSYEIGQRLLDAGQYFDYVSFMLYPSHFYGGFASGGVNFAYPEVVSHPYEVVFYSVLSARDYLNVFDSQAKVRPWLQDFDLKQDRAREVFYDAEKVRFQIEGAENATSSGWLLWSPSYDYTREALASSTDQ